MHGCCQRRVVYSEKLIGNYVEECNCDHFQVYRGIYIECMRKITKISFMVMRVPMEVTIV